MLVMFGHPPAIATGFVLVITVAAPVDTLSFAVVTIPFLLLLLEPMLTISARSSYFTTIVGVPVGIGGGSWLLLNQISLWLVAAIVCCTLAGLGYGVSRYQLLQLGLLGDQDIQNSATRQLDQQPPQTNQDGQSATKREHE
jgi:hypothetical protein